MRPHKNVTLFRWIYFFANLRFYIPIAVLYFSHVAHSFTLGMSVFSVIFIVSAFLEVPTGIFSDFLGRRGTTILSILLVALALGCYAAATSVVWLFVGGVIEGAARALASGNNYALLHGTLSQSNEIGRYPEWLGKVQSMEHLASAIASIVGGVIAFTWSYQATYWLSLVSESIAIALSLQLINIRLPETGQVKSHLGIALHHFFTNPKLRLLSLSYMLNRGVGDSSFEFKTAYYATLWPVWAIGIARTIASLCASYSFYISGQVIKKFSALKTIIIENIYTHVINLLALFFPSILSPAIMSSTSLFFGVGLVAENTLLQQQFTDEQRATMASLNEFGASLLYAGAAFGLGLLADLYSPVKALIFVEVGQFAILFLYARLYSNRHSASIKI